MGRAEEDEAEEQPECVVSLNAAQFVLREAVEAGELVGVVHDRAVRRRPVNRRPYPQFWPGVFHRSEAEPSKAVPVMGSREGPGTRRNSFEADPGSRLRRMAVRGLVAPNQWTISRPPCRSTRRDPTGRGS